MSNIQKTSPPTVLKIETKKIAEVPQIWWLQTNTIRFLIFVFGQKLLFGTIITIFGPLRPHFWPFLVFPTILRAKNKKKIVLLFFH